MSHSEILNQEVRNSVTYYMFARQNPVYRPRRNHATAYRWLQAVARWCEWSYHTDVHTVTQWAAKVVLDVGNWDCKPPGWRHSDDGGVERDALRKIARILLGQLHCPYNTIHVRTEFTLQWRAWSTLYPLTARASLGFYPKSALAEWELIYQLSETAREKALDGWPYTVVVDGVETDYCDTDPSPECLEYWAYNWTHPSGDHYGTDWQELLLVDSNTGVVLHTVCPQILPLLMEVEH